EVAVPLVPDRELVEADRAPQERQAGEEKHLDQREESTEQPREPPDPVPERRPPVGGEREVEVVVRDPEPAERGDVAEHECPDESRDDEADGAVAGRRGLPPDGGACHRDALCHALSIAGGCPTCRSLPKHVECRECPDEERCCGRRGTCRREQCP